MLQGLAQIPERVEEGSVDAIWYSLGEDMIDEKLISLQECNNHITYDVLN